MVLWLCHGQFGATRAAIQEKLYGERLFFGLRRDLTVPFYGAKVSPADIEEVINSHPLLLKNVNSFQLVSYEDEQVNRRLRIHIEAVRSHTGELPSAEDLRDILFDGLCRCNQDFREVTRMFERDCVEVELHPFGEGPFAGRDIRVKNKYIG